MATETKAESYLTSLTCELDVPDVVKEEISITGLTLTESLLTPGLQTTMQVQNKLNMRNGIKNLDLYHGAMVNITVTRPILKQMNMKDSLTVRQKVYRLSNRELMNYNVEEFQLDACDTSLIVDATTFMSRSWSGASATPSKVVRDVLADCIKAQNVEVEDSYPPKTYIAENIHPFQVITQQADSALSIPDFDPSFVHYMTYQSSSGEDVPTHNFKSIKKLATQPVSYDFVYNGKLDTDQNYAMPNEILQYTFPCDFDLLSDALNGLDENGNEVFGLITYNPLSGTFSYNGSMGDCGTSPFSAATNLGTADDQKSYNTEVEKSLLRRKARMGLLEQDKIALRITVPFNPMMSVGKVITASFINTQTGDPLYGSGVFMIVSMTHNIKLGGFGITVLDCVSNTVAVGRV